MLDDLIVFYPKYVHNCHPVISLLPEKVTMDYDKISFSDESFEIEPERGKRPGKPVYECDKRFSPICSSGVVLPAPEISLRLPPVF